MQGQPHNEKVLKLTEQDVVPKQFDLLWKKNFTDVQHV